MRDGQTQIYVLVQSRLVVDGIFEGGLQRGQHLLGLCLSLVGSQTGHPHQLEAVAHASHHQRRVVATHHDDATKLAVGLRREAHLSRGGEGICGRLLQQHVGHQPEALPVGSQLVGVDAHGAEGGGHPIFLVVVGLPLPLLAQRGGVELVALLWVHNGGGGGRLRLAEGGHRLALAAHDGPAAAPVDGLQMHHATVGILVLEVQKPVFALRRVHPSTLVGAVHGGLALSQHNLMLVGAERTLRPHGQLEARGHTPGGAHNPVPSIALIELGTFAGAVLGAVAIEDDDGLADGAGAIGTQLAHGEHTGKLRPGVGPSVHQVAAAIIVPQRGGVDVSFATDDAHGGLPLAGRIAATGLHHIHTIVGVAPVDVVFALVAADAGCPDASSMTGRGKMLLQQRVSIVERAKGMAHDLPVHQVARVEDGQAGHALERRGREVEVVTIGRDANVGVAVVGIDDGVGVGAVAVVGAPHLRRVRLLGRAYKWQEGKQKGANGFHILFKRSL